MLSSLVGPFLIALLVALGSGALLIPILRRLKAQQIISTDAPQRHQTKVGTPTMGGVIILAGGTLAALLFPNPSGAGSRLLGVLVCTLAFGAIGFLDDYLIIKRGKNLGLRAREKLLGQFMVAIAFVAWLNLTESGGVTSGTLLTPARIGWGLFHVLLLVGMSNAVNLTDGLDGLAAGVSLPVWVTLAALGAFWSLVPEPITGGVSDYGMVVFCAAFAGATVGYVWYNAHPAQVFMGDTGALAIGGGIAAAAIVLRQEWLMLLAAAVHLAEAASVTLQVICFKSTGKRIFKRSPLHHHFEELEMPETRIVARFTIASVLFCLAALAVFFVIRL